MTQLECINAAFDELGEKPIDSIASTQDRALVALRQWPRSLRMFLRELPWNWARKLDELDPASPVPDFGWSYRYELPTDFITLTKLNETIIERPSDWWEIVGTDLHTDVDEAKIEYVHYPTDTALDTFLAGMDPKAQDAFIVLLAAKMAPAITRDSRDMAVSLLQQYQVALADARCRAANQRKSYDREQSSESRFVNARYGDIQG